jgi:hypothetical protein
MKTRELVCLVSSQEYTNHKFEFERRNVHRRKDGSECIIFMGHMSTIIRDKDGMAIHHTNWRQIKSNKFGLPWC